MILNIHLLSVLYLRYGPCGEQIPSELAAVRITQVFGGDSAVGEIYAEHLELAERILF